MSIQDDKFRDFLAGLPKQDASAEAEKIIANVDPTPSHKPAPDHWYKKPGPVIIISVISGLILLGVRYILKNHFGLNL